MKKLLYFAVAALAFVACAKEMTPEKEVVKETPKVKVSIKAVLAQEPETKAEIDLTTGIGSWEKDDEIAVYSRNGNWIHLKAESAGTSVTFSGEIDEGDAIDNNAVAYYPATITVSSDVTKVELPTSYPSAAAAAKGFLLRGVLTGDAVEFKHIGALLKVTINDIPESVTSLEFSAASKAITGQLDVIQEGENPLYCAAGAGSNDNRTITIATTSAERTSSATVLCIPMPVGTYTNGFSIILKAGSTVAATKTSTNNVTISRAKVVKMKAFTPEEASGWFVAGGFNRWSTTATAMTAVEGHDGWLVAKNIDVTPVDGQSAGFKFYNGAWKGSNGAGLHTQYDGANENNSSNITPSNGKYDIYLNPTANKYFIANAGEDWYRTIYLMTDMTLSEKTYYLHIWGHGGGASLTGDAPGVAGTTETISGIKYYKFNVGIDNSPAGSYDCRFKSDDGDVQYCFNSGQLVLNDASDQFYASFTSTSYNTNHGENVDNPLTMFADSSHPQGESTWCVYINGGVHPKMQWGWNNGPVLVKKNVVIGPSSEVCFRYFEYQDIFYAYAGTTITPNTEFAVIHTPSGGSRSAAQFTIPSLDANYICDVYLDIFNNKAIVIPQVKDNATTTLYFGVPDSVAPNTDSPVFLYTWNGYEIGKWVNDGNHGASIAYDKAINGVKFYKAIINGSNVWESNVNLLLNNYTPGASSSWQSHDFTTADWTGYKSEYWFNVLGQDIVQLSGDPSSVTIDINGDMSEWNDVLIGTASSSSVYSVFKAAFDTDNIYLYSRRTNNSALWGTSAGYLYYDFDIGNDANGSLTEGSRSGLDAFTYLYLYGGTSSEPTIKASPNGSGSGMTISNIVCKGVITKDFVETELLIPRENLPAISAGTSVKIYSWGSQNANLMTLILKF